MEIINLHLDKDKNLHTSLTGLIYLMENGHLENNSQIIQIDLFGKEIHYLFRYDENEMALSTYTYNEQEDIIETELSITEDNIFSEYIIKKGGFTLDENEIKKVEPQEPRIQSNFLDRLMSNTHTPDNITFVFPDNEDNLTEEDEQEIIDYIMEMLAEEGIEDDEDVTIEIMDISIIPKNKNIMDIMENEKPLRKNKFTKREINAILKKEKDEKNFFTLDEVLKDALKVFKK